MTRRCLLLGIVVLFTAGCSRTPTPSTDGQVSVKGRVEGADGKPLPGVLVRLHAETTDSINTVGCVCDDKGAFAGTCPPGDYKVTVVSLKTGKADLVPPAYRTPKDTPLTLKVGPKGKKDVVFTLDPDRK